MSFYCAMGDKYDISNLIPIKKVPFHLRMIARLSFPLYIPKLLYQAMSIKHSKNPLHDGARILSGQKRVASSSDFYLQDLKDISKSLKVTINDLLTACLASTIKQYFLSKGDTKTNKVNIVIPANIRFQHYETLEEIKLENKFAPVPLPIPLFENVVTSLQEISKITSKLRSSFGEIYATYALSYYCAMIMPYFVCNYFCHLTTLPFTLAFSNTPGMLRPLMQEGKKSRIMQNYLISAGHCGLAFSCISHADFFKICVVVDSAVMKEPEELMKLLERNIKECRTLAEQQTK